MSDRQMMTREAVRPDGVVLWRARYRLGDPVPEWRPPWPALPEPYTMRDRPVDADQPERCPTCESDDREVLQGECADRATRYGEGKRVRLRLVDSWHQHRETTREVERLREQIERERIERTTAHGGVVGPDPVAKLRQEVERLTVEITERRAALARPKLDSAPGPILDSGRGK